MEKELSKEDQENVNDAIAIFQDLATQSTGIGPDAIAMLTSAILIGRKLDNLNRALRFLR